MRECPQQDCQWQGPCLKHLCVLRTPWGGKVWNSPSLSEANGPEHCQGSHGMPGKVWASTAKHHRPSDLNKTKQNIFFTVLEPGSQRPGHRLVRCLVRAHFLVPRQPSPLSTPGGRDEGALWSLFHKSINTIHKVSAFMT